MNILNKVKVIDQFKRPVLLFTSGQQMHSTFLGTFLSLCLFAFLIYYVIISDMVTRENPKIIDETLEVDRRPEIKLDYLYFSVENEDGVIIVEPSVFTIRGLELQLKMNETSQKLEYVSRIDKELRLCQEDDFKPGVFAKRGLSGKYCFENKNLYLSGYWDENDIKYIWVSLRRCVNSTENNNTCKSDDEIDEFFKTDLYFNTFYFNPFVQMADYNDPIKSVWKTEYKQIDTSILKEINIFFKQVIFTDDKNLPFKSSENHKTYNFEKIDADVHIKYRSEEMIVVAFYSSNLVSYKTRKYKGLSEVLAELSGIRAILFILGSILIEPVFKLSMMLGFFNERVKFRSNTHSPIYIEKKKLIDENNSNNSNNNNNYGSDNINNEKKQEPANIYEPEPIPSDPDIHKDSGRIPHIFNCSHKKVKIKKISVVDVEANIEQSQMESVDKTVNQEKKPSTDKTETVYNIKNISINSSDFVEKVKMEKKSKKDSPKFFKSLSELKKKLSNWKLKKKEGFIEKINFSLLEFIKIKLKLCLSLKLKKHEKLLLEIEKKFSEDLNIGFLLQRLFIIEKKIEAIEKASYEMDPNNNMMVESIKTHYKQFTVADMLKN